MIEAFVGLSGSRAARRFFGLCTFIMVLTWGIVHAQSTTASIVTGAGSQPYAVAVNPVTNQVYVADRGTGVVTAINGPDNTQTTIPLGNNPTTGKAMVSPIAIAVDAVANRIYVANQGTVATAYSNGGVTVINGANNAVIATVAMPAGPTAIAVNPITHQVYVPQTNVQGTNWLIGVIDGPTNTATQVANRYISGATSIPGVRPSSVAVNTATNQVFFGNGSGTLTILDGPTNAILGMPQVTPSQNPVAVAVNEGLNHVYVACSYSSTTINPAVVVVDPTQTGTFGKGKLVKTVTVGSIPNGLAVNPVTNKIYVANQGATYITVIQDGSSTGDGQTITVGNHPFGVAVSPITNQVFVTNQASNSVSVINGDTSTVTTSVAVGNQPGAIALNPITGKAYVANLGDSVSVIDGAANAATLQFVGTQPSAVGINRVTNKVYVANRGASSVTVIDVASGTSTAVAVGPQPVAVAVNEVTNKIYVANLLGFSVSVIDGATNTTTLVRSGPNPVGIAVNPVTNLVYVANQGTALKNFADSNVAVIDGATNIPKAIPFGSDVNNFIAGALQLAAIAIDVPNNAIYVVNKGTSAGGYLDGSVYQLNGLDNFTITELFSGSGPIQPQAVAISPTDSNGNANLYVANYGSANVDVFQVNSGTGAYVTTVATGANPNAIAVNPNTGLAYVTNSGTNTVTAINGNFNPLTGTYPFTTTNIVTGTVPYAVAVNPVTDKIYVPARSNNNVTVIDGATNTTSSLNTGGAPVAVAVNTNTGKAYIANLNTNNLTVLTDAVASATANPLVAELNPVPDANTVSAALFATATASPTFSGVVQSLFGPTAPAPNALYFQLDGTQGLWNSAGLAGSIGTNPADYSIALAGLTPGIHTLYAYGTYGAEGTPVSASGSGNSPQVSRVVALPFAITNPPTTTTVTADVNPVNAGFPVTFTGCVEPAGSVEGAGGTVTFFDSGKLLGSKIIDPLDPNGPNPCPQLKVTTLKSGVHQITATYSQNSLLYPSSGSMTEEVDLNLVLQMSYPLPLSGNPPCSTVNTISCPIYGSAPVKIAAHVPLAGTITFSVNGVAKPPITVVAGVATLTLPGLAAGTYSIDATFTGSGQSLNATTLTFPVLQKAASVTVYPESRAYGAPDKFTSLLIGFTTADKANIVVNYSSTVAPTAAPGTYANAITATLTDNNVPPVLGNYAITYGAPATETVRKAILTVTATSFSRAYGAAEPTLNVTISGAVPSDNITGYATSTDQPTSLPGTTYTLTPHLNANPALTNYSLVLKTGTATITTGQLTVTATDQTIVTGAPLPTFTGTITGALASDNITATYSTTVPDSSVPGAYPINATITPNSRLVYYNVTTTPGTLTITP